MRSCSDFRLAQTTTGDLLDHDFSTCRLIKFGQFHPMQAYFAFRSSLLLSHANKFQVSVAFIRSTAMLQCRFHIIAPPLAIEIPHADESPQYSSSQREAIQTDSRRLWFFAVTRCLTTCYLNSMHWHHLSHKFYTQIWFPSM